MKSIFKSIIVWIITLEARLVLRKYKPKIVAITGSVGKTSTKDAIHTVLSGYLGARKSQKSFNSEIGVPLTILNCDNGWSNPILWLKNIIEGLLLMFLPNRYPEVLVLEVGADRPGDIKKITKWLKPDIAVFTTVGNTPVHIEFFKEVNDLIEEKAYLVKALKSSGTLIYTEDDPNITHIAEYTKAERYSFGFLGGAYFRGSHDEIMYEGGKPTGMRFRIDFEGNSIPAVVNGVLGKQHIYPILASVAVAKAFDLNMIKISEYLEEHEAPKGRMRIIDGIKNSTLIDDTYNSSPIAVSEALEALSRIEINAGQKKIAVLGDMMELGKHSADEHYNIGKKVANVADVLVTVGVRSRKIVEGALDNGLSEKKIYQFEESVVAGKFLEGIIDPKDIVLIKGSQSMRMEKAVKEVMAEPMSANKLLVRQEDEWGRR